MLPTNVTVDDIKRLRFEGKRDEVEDLLRAFRECGKKNIEKGRKINNSIYGKELRIKRRRKGLCTLCDNKAMKGRKLCKKHILYYREIQKKKREKEKKRSEQ